MTPELIVNLAGSGPARTIRLLVPDEPGVEYYAVALPLDEATVYDTTLLVDLIADRLAREAAGTVRPMVVARITEARRHLRETTES